MTAVRPKQRYGVLKLNKNKVFFDNSNEKSDVYINGGFFGNKDAIKKIKNPKMYWKKEPLTYFIQKNFCF